jgi:hypothetical protein
MNGFVRRWFGLEKDNVAVYGDVLGKMVITGNLNVVSQTF